jgi:hypothetical protein
MAGLQGACTALLRQVQGQEQVMVVVAPQELHRHLSHNISSNNENNSTNSNSTL